MLNDDAGATYAWGTDGKGSVIAYNWVHHSVQNHTVGIYLDNFCKNFVVHHNVVWACGSSGITLNCDAHNHLVANNTIAQCPKAFGTFAYHRYTPDQTGTRIVNNLLLAHFDPTDPGHVISGAKGATLDGERSGGRRRGRHADSGLQGHRRGRRHFRNHGRLPRRGAGPRRLRTGRHSLAARCGLGSSPHAPARDCLCAAGRGHGTDDAAGRTAALAGRIRREHVAAGRRRLERAGTTGG